MACGCTDITPVKDSGDTKKSSPDDKDYLDPLYVVMDDLGETFVFFDKEDLNEFLDETDILSYPDVMIVKADCVTRVKIGAL